MTSWCEPSHPRRPPGARGGRPRQCTSGDTPSASALPVLYSRRPSEAATCRQYADALARERGDLLPEELYRSLMPMRLWCQLSAALRDGKERIDEP
jgi:hypothetical protein